ncbi:energy transducer TonB [Cytophagaceae bacterium DM2B3-1]|uniref:Energy transducer TonB n=1 Tax=Xanthocytophaga flava TaxID=3048013 RepID=A0ABT7CL31_9BACT|nr:energy transducer TonB [Xanthocytophaga flavus]MDJ1469943.1 energy transducer TonB [Xanthocytophaga flavus]MDJ1494453.1 energy transducer TonB [Xanthocytophaga flavus]
MQKYTSVILLIILTACDFHKETDVTVFNSHQTHFPTLHKTTTIDSKLSERAPQFPGGEEGLKQFITDNLQSPPEALKAEVTGKVYVSFTVGDKGLLQDIKVIKGLGYRCDEEVVRLVRHMPVWEPALQGGHPIDVNYILPIEFKSTRIARK